MNRVTIKVIPEVKEGLDWLKTQHKPYWIAKFPDSAAFLMEKEGYRIAGVWARDNSHNFKRAAWQGVLEGDHSDYDDKWRAQHLRKKCWYRSGANDKQA